MADLKLSHHLIKRNLNFSDLGIFKRKGGKEWKSESKKGSAPLGWHSLEPNDIVWLYEGDYAIIAKGILLEKSQLHSFNSLDMLLAFHFKAGKIKDIKYLYELLKKKYESPKPLKYYEYLIDIELLDQPIQIPEKLKKIQNSVYKITDDNLIDELVNPKISDFRLRTPDIPNIIRHNVFYIHSINPLDKLYIDVDHLIPASLGGFGNFIENLNPVSYSINRTKNNRVPSGLFSVAGKMNAIKNIKIPSKYLTKKMMISDNEAKKLAFRIMRILNKKLNDKELKNFYLKVMKIHRTDVYKNLMKYSKTK